MFTKTKMAALMTLAMIGSPLAQAEEVSNNQQAGVILSSSAVGAVLGGPVGFVVGAFVGDWATGHWVKSAERDELAQNLVDKELELLALNDDLKLSVAKVDSLSHQLGDAQQSLATVQQLALNQLAFNLPFRTGAFTLTEENQQLVAKLASLIKKHPNLQIKLAGYADPRGDSDYNYQLTVDRVNAVAEVLKQAGIDGQRITMAPYGAAKAVVKEGDYDGYAMERRVVVELVEPVNVDFALQKN